MATKSLVFRVRLSYCKWIIVFTPIISGCAAIPVPSHLSLDDKLPIVQTLGKGETIVVYGVNADPPPDESSYQPYFTFGCRNVVFQRDTMTRLTDSIRDGNPAILATKSLREELKSMLGVELPPAGLDLKLSDKLTAKVLEDHVRYLLFVKEKVETTIHVPLYIVPFGIAACGHKTILEAGVWEMPSGNGTLTASAEAEFVVLAWLIHLILYSETQASAVQKLTQEIIEKLTGSTPDEKTSP